MKRQSMKAQEREEFKTLPMIYWSGLFFVIAIVAGLLGLDAKDSPAVGIAWILFVLGVTLGSIFLEFHRRIKGAPD